MYIYLFRGFFFFLSATERKIKESMSGKDIFVCYQHHNRWTWFDVAASIIIVIVCVVIALYAQTHTLKAITFSCAFLGPAHPILARWFDALPFTYKWKIPSITFQWDYLCAEKTMYGKCVCEREYTKRIKDEYKLLNDWINVNVNERDTNSCILEKMEIEEEERKVEAKYIVVENS